MKRKIYLLFSGGLDSIIAARLLQDMGFDVVGVHITSPLFEKDVDKVKELAEKVGIELKIVKAGDDYLEMLKAPVYGYGKNLNPCIDCKAYMLKKVKEIAGNNPIATGEVLGQRPMSQRLDAFKKIEKLAGLEKKVIRPLSGKLLPPTVYEEEGLFNREKFLDFKGRSRKRYPEILRSLGLDEKELPTPAGGCLLTEPSFSKKVKDLSEHNELTWENIELLKVGRHFRLNGCKLIVGRNKLENQKIENSAKSKDLVMKVIGIPSPSALLRCEKELKEDIKRLAASIVARYSDAPKDAPSEVGIFKNGKLIEKVMVKPIEDAKEFLVTYNRVE